MSFSTLDLSTLSVTFDEEFNSFVSSPNGSSGWMTSFPFGGQEVRTLAQTGEQEYYSDASVGENPFSLGNGMLDIVASPAAAGSNPLDLPYDSGLITTYKSFSQLYGYFEMRAELPAGDGMWPGFWLLPVNNQGAAELDILETHGNNPDTLYVTAISSVLGINDQTAVTVPNTSTGFHTYGVDWEPKTITFYFDGQAIASVPTPATMNTPMYALVNLAVGGPDSWGGGTDASTPFPADMLVDYVRAYATANTQDVSGPQSLTTPGVPQPSIIGAISGQAMIDQTTIRPFANIRIVDATGQNETITVAEADPSSGSLSSAGAGSYDARTGIFTVSGAPAAVTAALQALVFTPAIVQGAPQTASFDVTASDGTASATDTATTVTVEHGTLTVSGQTIDGTAPATSTALEFTDAAGTNVILGGSLGLRPTT